MKPTSLQLSKLESLKERELLKNELICLEFNFHSISIEFFSTSEKLIKDLKNYLPASWQKNFDENESTKKVFHSPPPSHLKEIFDDEESSDVFHHVFHPNKEENIFAVQRDFVASVDSYKTKYNCMFEGNIDDGLHNFFRWMLSPLLLKNSKAMLHAAALVDKNNNALLFLGPSGAGKTTITELGAPRLILSDDMNLIDFSSNELTCAAGGVGGLYKPQVALDSKFQIKNIFWLNQSKENSITQLPPLKQTQYVLSSFANLPWETFDNSTQTKVFDAAQTIVTAHNIQQLNFKKESEVWNLIDSL